MPSLYSTPSNLSPSENVLGTLSEDIPSRNGAHSYIIERKYWQYHMKGKESKEKDP